MHLGIDSSTDLDDRYSNIFLNAYINRHAHTEYLKMIEVYIVTTQILNCRVCFTLEEHTS